MESGTSSESFQRSWENFEQLLSAGKSTLLVVSIVSFVLTLFWWTIHRKKESPRIRALLFSSTVAAMIAWTMALELWVRSEFLDSYSRGHSTQPYEYPTTLITLASLLVCPVFGWDFWMLYKSSASRFVRLLQFLQLMTWVAAVFVAYHFALLV